MKLEKKDRPLWMKVKEEEMKKKTARDTEGLRERAL